MGRIRIVLRRLPARVRALRLLNVAPLARRPMRVALAVVAVGTGVSLLLAVVIEQHSLTASVTQVSRGLAGPTPLRVVGPSSHGGVTDSVVRRIRAVPGVRAAAPVVQAVAVAQGRAGRTYVIALGVDCSIQAVTGSFGCSNRALAASRVGQQPLVTPQLLRGLGTAAYLRTDLGRIPLTDAATTTRLATVNDGRVAVFPLRQAQQEFARAGQVDTVYVAPAPGTSVAELQRRLTRALPPGHTVLRGDAPPPSAGYGGLLVPLLGLIALMALGIAALLVFNIMSLTLAERRRELAVAAALGAAPRLTIAGALVEAAVQGALGGALGCVAGVLIAHPLVASLSEQVALFSGVHLHVRVDAVTLALGPVVGVVTAVGAAWLPARRAARVDVVAELHARTRLDAPRPARRARSAIAVVAAGLAGVALSLLAGRHAATSSWQPPAGSLGLLVATLAFIGLAVIAAPLVIGALRPWARRRGGLLDVAVRTLAAEPRRTGVAATAVAAAVAFSSMLVAAIPAIDAVTVRLFGTFADGRVYVSTLDFNNTMDVDSKVSPAVRGRLARLPGVASVDAVDYVTAPVDGTRTIVTAVDDTPPPYGAVEGVASAAALARGEVFVGAALARTKHLHPGSFLTVDSPAGRARLRVAAVWTDPDNIGSSLTMDLRGLSRLFGPQPPTALFVRPRAGVTAGELATQIRQAHLDTGLLVQPPQEFLAAMAASVRSMLAPFWTLQRALLAVALVATLSTLLLVGVQRRRELGTLAALGLAPRSLAGMTVLEAGLVGAVGCALGVAAGAITGLAMLSDAVFLTGAAPSFQFDVAATARYALLAVVVVVAGAAWPAWRTSRLPVIEALRHE